MATGYAFQCAREFFEAARMAVVDAERVRRRMAEAEAGAEGLGWAWGGVAARSQGDPGRMAARVAAKVDMEAPLRERLEGDMELVRTATRVLYGDDGRAGLWALVGWRADTLAMHYLEGRTWAAVGEALGYSERHVWQQAQVALDVCDANGMLATIEGRGHAEG